MQKKLQKESIYAEYDEDGDGIVSDEELSHLQEDLHGTLRGGDHRPYDATSVAANL